MTNRIVERSIGRIVYKINITKGGKVKNILTTAIFLIWSIYTVRFTITPPADVDAFVILATETIITTDVALKNKLAY